MTDQTHPVRVRFAPSPTGELHLGGARTALYNYLFAKQRGGTIILRVEDTDQKRFVSGSMDRFMEDLAWLGITFDESPALGGPDEPYIQSERSARHAAVAHELVDKGAAYYEFDSTAGGGAKADESYRSGHVVYRSPERDADSTQARQRIAAGEPFVVRLKVPLSGKIQFQDAVRGEVEFDLSTIDDSVLLKSDGMATYHLAAMVDDHDMNITYLFRTEEWLPSTPKHLLIFQAMGWTLPQIAHLPLLLALDGKKLSKRIHGEAVWLRTYRDAGYLPEAMINYLALLGWNPGGDREFFSMNELIKEFSLERVHKAGAKFDQAKLDSFQQHYVKQLAADVLQARIQEYLNEQSLPVPEQPLFEKLVELVHDRLGAFEEFPTLIASLTQFHDGYPAEMLIFKKSTLEITKQGLRAAIETLEKLPTSEWSDRSALETSLLTTVAASAGTLTNGDLFWPVRVALTGAEKSLPPPDCLWVLGRAESLRRMAIAVVKLSQIS